MISPSPVPPDLYILTVIEIGNIRFDVKQRTAIQHVNALDIETIAFHVQQMNDREPDWVGPAWITSGKDAVFLIIQKRFDLQVIAPWTLNQV